MFIKLFGKSKQKHCVHAHYYYYTLISVLRAAITCVSYGANPDTNVFDRIYFLQANEQVKQLTFPCHLGRKCHGVIGWFSQNVLPELQGKCFRQFTLLFQSAEIISQTAIILAETVNRNPCNLGILVALAYLFTISVLLQGQHMEDV